MACYRDLDPCPYFGTAWASHLAAVGWLGKEMDYPKGAVDSAFRRKLQELIANAWQPLSYRGWHDCEFCTPELRQEPYGPEAGIPGVRTIVEGVYQDSRNLFIPGQGFLYVAPTMILHYMEAHNYAPPSQFQKAVLECPPMQSRDYFRAIHTNASPEWLDVVQRFHGGDDAWPFKSAL